MKVYRFLPAARDAIERAGITQVEIATAAGIDRHHFNKRLNGEGGFRPATANRIARAFAVQTQTTQDRALAELFEVFDNDSGAKRAPKPTMPSRDAK